jgi:alpha-L-rhamnosidase
MSEERVHLNDAGSDAPGIPDAPRDLAIDFGGDQFAVSAPTPRLSWKPVSDVASYDVEAEIDGSRHLFTTARYRHVAWPWPPLASRQSVRS